MEAVLNLVARGALRLDDLIEAIVPVEDAVEAYRRLTGPAEERPSGARSSLRTPMLPPQTMHGSRGAWRFVCRQLERPRERPRLRCGSLSSVPKFRTRARPRAHACRGAARGRLRQGRVLS